MSSILEARVQALEERPLERGPEGPKGEKGERGPRGPAGPIDAAIRNAHEAVADAERRVQAKADTELLKFQEEVNNLKADFNVLKSMLADTIKDTVDNHRVSVLRDYHLLDENNSPEHWKQLPNH